MPDVAGDNVLPGLGGTSDANPLAGLREKLDANYLVNEGRQRGLSLPAFTSKEEEDVARKSLEGWAKSEGMFYAQAFLIRPPDELEDRSLRVRNLDRQLPEREDKVTQARERLEEVERDCAVSTTTAAPRPPAMWVFLLVAAGLGLVFGLIGATTINSILKAIWKTPAQTMENPDSFYLAWSVVIGAFMGLVVSTFAILTRQYAAKNAGLGLWGPPLVGLFFALGLSGYRMIQNDPDNVGHVRMVFSGLAIVLIFLEIGILFGIEVVNSIAHRAWTEFHDAQAKYERGRERLEAARAEYQRREHLFAEAKGRYERERDELRMLQKQDALGRNAVALERFLTEQALRGFESGRREKKESRS